MLIAAFPWPPIFDCMLLMGRRLGKGRRDHLHHIFERAGLGKRSTALAIGGYLTLNAALALLFWQLRLPEFALTALFLGAFVSRPALCCTLGSPPSVLRATWAIPSAATYQDNVVELDRSVGS